MHVSALGMPNSVGIRTWYGAFCQLYFILLQARHKGPPHVAARMVAITVTVVPSAWEPEKPGDCGHLDLSPIWGS